MLSFQHSVHSVDGFSIIKKVHSVDGILLTRKTSIGTNPKLMERCQENDDDDDDH